MHVLFIALLTALTLASQVELEVRQDKPDPNTVYIESASTFFSSILHATLSYT
jgi:hypothetical protein